MLICLGHSGRYFLTAFRALRAALAGCKSTLRSTVPEASGIQASLRIRFSLRQFLLSCCPI